MQKFYLKNNSVFKRTYVYVRLFKDKGNSPDEKKTNTESVIIDHKRAKMDKDTKIPRDCGKKSIKINFRQISQRGMQELRSLSSWHLLKRKIHLNYPYKSKLPSSQVNLFTPHRKTCHQSQTFSKNIKVVIHCLMLHYKIETKPLRWNFFFVYASFHFSVIFGIGWENFERMP